MLPLGFPRTETIRVGDRAGPAALIHSSLTLQFNAPKQPATMRTGVYSPIPFPLSLRCVAGAAASSSFSPSAVVLPANVTVSASSCRHLFTRSPRLRFIFLALLCLSWIDCPTARSVSPLAQLLTLRRFLTERAPPLAIGAGAGAGQDVDDNAYSLASGLVRKRAVDPNDPPRIMCGQTLIDNLKKQCGARGTFSPNWKRSYSQLAVQPRGDETAFESPLPLQKRYDDLCSVYLQYEPDSPLSQCCCLGCTNAYLEGFCAEK